MDREIRGVWRKAWLNPPKAFVDLGSVVVQQGPAATASDFARDLGQAPDGYGELVDAVAEMNRALAAQRAP